ncbi:hypothetical protein JW962_02960 [Candidatus Dojkabacteria bacterium]|nr:hypothetical protein [Candidatus Dojkabacteria bacterium]
MKIKNKIEVTYKTINLNPVDEIKTVIYESEYVILTFNYSDVINYLNEVKYNSQESKNIKQYIEEQGLTTNEIIISEISIYYIGDLIELSTVKVYDKVSDRYVEEVEVEERHIHCGPMCESGQKHYRIQHDKDPFLSIPTWIS